MTIHYESVKEIIENDGATCPLPLEVIPNKMGINLCSVEGISWEKQDDGQLKELRIHFIPATEEDKKE